MIIWVYILVLFIIHHVYRWVRHYPWLGGLHKKCVFITGCDSGFGYATARSLYRRGVFVFAACYTEEGAEKLRQETGDRLRTVILDVSKSESIAKAYRYVRDNLPPDTVLWGVVNNAGIGGDFGPLDFVRRQNLREVMEVNCFGMIEVAKVFLPLLKSSKGRLVNVASMAGEIPLSNAPGYCASKFALRGYSEVLRYELSIWDIQVCIIEPGTFLTSILDMDKFQANFTRQWSLLDAEIQAEYGQEYFDSVIQGVTGFVKSSASPDVTPVVRAFEHALYACRPYPKYRPGLDCKLMLFLREYCPSIIMDTLALVMIRKNLPRVLRERE